MRLPVFRDPVSRQPSVSVTLTAVTFFVVIIRWCIGGLSVRGHTFSTVSTGEIEAWLSPVFLLYFGRKGTDAAANVAMTKKTGGSGG